VATSRSSTVFSLREILIASQPVLTSTEKKPLNISGLATSRLDSRGMTPPT